MMKKVVALLMSVMMLLSMTPAYAAADNAAQIGKYYEVNDGDGTLPSAPSLSEGSTQQAYSATAGGEELLWVDKTIAPTGKENQFEVTLEVVTGQKIEHIDLTEDAATVLVIDVSGSMDDYDGGSTRRLTRAKRAAQTFINTFANVSGDVTRKVAIVKFSTTATTVSGTNNNRWVDASSVDTESNRTYCAPINALQYGGGTNIEAGMLLAKNLLDDPAIDDIKNKNIVLLTDGKPTYGVSDRGENNSSSSTTTVPSSDDDVIGGGRNTTCNSDRDTHEDVEALCQSLKSAGNGMYAVYIGSQDVNCGDCDLSKSGQNWLAQDCGFAAYAATDADKLVQIFENISLQIAARAQAWVVTDPMGTMVDYMQVTDADTNAFSYDAQKDTVSWDLKLDNTFVTDEADGTYTYTAKYNISLDTMADDFAEGVWYPTNKETQVTWVLLDEDGNITGADQEDGGVRKAYFNIPSVQGYKAPIKKIDETGAALAGAEFTLAHSDNCPDCTASAANKAAWASVTGVSGSDGTITFNGDAQIPSGHTYTLTETRRLMAMSPQRR